MHRGGAITVILLTLITYNENIAPLLRAHCVECHAYGSVLNLAVFPFISKFTEDQHVIVERILIRAGGANPTMPPGNRPKLTAGEVSLIQQWKDQGLEP